MSHPGGLNDASSCAGDAAPYVLGALAPDEAGAFARHLAVCTVCRDEVEALAPVLEALTAAAPAHSAPKALRRRVLRAVKAEPKLPIIRRRRRVRALIRTTQAGWLAFGAAMAAAAVVQLGPAGSHERVIPASIGAAELRVTGGHGQLVVAQLPPLPVNRTYQVWLQTAARRFVPSTLFGVTTRGTASVGVAGGLHGVRSVLVTVEPRGGSLFPTTRAVIVEPLPE